ncbi:Alcohol dehydrogenase GroES domain protein [Candidatus Sulfotelmatomonas gaucii]|uniref:Alcohol dehydrogenase GroES domain protein n=1 Tax=Candidatus Sulfuritelmatomonas gaucii TaxID=2043161 RepID=A0A2N9LJP5_9BACT|nr:Alcohol dehydrogenase GroES domain protein [Candidatus Sulfotelmatomonas gaucii]
MRAAELTAPHTFRLAEMAIDDPGPGEVQVRVEAVGVCGSDLHAYCEGAVGGTPNVYPMVIGHEPAGSIVKTGAGVTGLAAGDRGALEPALYCYHCEFCLSGRHNVCANLRFLSTPRHPGFFREFVNLPAANFQPIPATMPYANAALAEPLAVAMHSLHQASIGPGETVAVIGTGPIGLLTIAALRAARAGRIWAVEPLAHRRELARQIGADAVIEPEEAAKEILDGTGQRGVDCAIDCAAKEHTTIQAMEITRNAGRIALTGIHSTALVSMDGSTMRRKELTIFNVRRSNHETEEALELLKEHGEWFAPMLTHTRQMEQIDEAFEIASQYSDGVGKMIVKP